MPSPLGLQLSVFKHILRRKLAGERRFPLVLMLEPLFACNLECAGCGKVQHPPDIMKKRLTPEECLQAARECGAPVVSIAGGEPLIHPEIGAIVEGLTGLGRFVFLCTNALLLEKNLPRFRPSSRLILSVHLDGREEVHDRIVGRPGVYRTAVAAIRRAKAEGFQVMTNSTIYQGQDPEEFRNFCRELSELGTDGIMIAPGFAYDKAKGQDLFLALEATRAWFREALKDWRRSGWDFNHSPFYLDFLEGRREYDCTPWGLPLRSVLGWQRPCYLFEEGGYAASYKELLEATPWDRYGRAAGHPRCAQCMSHVGFEPSSVLDAFSSIPRFLAMARDFSSRGSARAR
ncbi:MAG: adenosyl-hopene transferase HpnH, partial [Elusimicrobia bacterium]|nr:adenosyl-hopene transferase HpnH [Elusimicrobiota bacterium]